MKEKICENCKFWQRDSDVLSSGTCHRYAPRPALTDPVEGLGSMDAIWPTAKNDQWCGEWQARVEIDEED